MKNALHRLVLVLAGTIGLAVVAATTATPALAAGLNHTEPFTAGDLAPTGVSAPSSGGAGGGNRDGQ